jgi:hypothetical protein
MDFEKWGQEFEAQFDPLFTKAFIPMYENRTMKPAEIILRR